jgi:uncharacterized Tic20 family protein
MLGRMRSDQLRADRARRDTDDAGLTDQEKNTALICHALAFTHGLFPFAAIVCPLVLWQLRKDDSEFIDFHGKECVNFQISMLIWTVLAIPLCFVIVGIPILLGLFVCGVICTVIALMKAGRGEYYRYPLTIRFLK